LQISSPDVISGKKIIWILGRQHPGETTGSFMMEGIIEYLLS
jgi:murein tripeptide amidase MpaA